MKYQANSDGIVEIKGMIQEQLELFLNCDDLVEFIMLDEKLLMLIKIYSIGIFNQHSVLSIDEATYAESKRQIEAIAERSKIYPYPKGGV